MLFYKLQAELREDSTQEEGDRTRRRALKHQLALKTIAFNENRADSYCFLSETGEGLATFGVIATEEKDFVKLGERFAKALSLSASNFTLEEITFNNMRILLAKANHERYIEDDDEVLGRFFLGPLCRGLDFGENMLDRIRPEEELQASARENFVGETLLPELARIYSGGKIPRAKGHPVHYFVETNNRDLRREVCRTLLEALHANGRLRVGRYAFVDFDDDSSYSYAAYDSLYKMSDGGAILVRFQGAESDEEGTAGQNLTVIENLCRMAKQYRNRVLTVFCLPHACKALKQNFYEQLGSMAFVEIHEDFLDKEGAARYFKKRAREECVSTDKELFAMLEEDRTYLCGELSPIFDEWYGNKLRRKIHPQYKDMTVAHGEMAKAKPRGTAYEELAEMVGLSEAKAVINKALSYYKMQKLYAEHGIKSEEPAMHMIFTGNPGTAKTTVARLFSRIMRENGLLARGHLVEVGRGDLVGKYVGWTAKTVQAKFREAMGGVLFIDEAYSLVDDREGSFGGEAINTIVQEMENHRADLVVIFAGYPDKMQRFLSTNPGLRSRIAFHVPFADYDSEELLRIAELVCRRGGMKLDGGAREKMATLFDAVRTEGDFGNGRFVRNLFEQAKMNQASRLLEKNFEDITLQEITTLTADDIVIPERKKTERKAIGF